MAQTFQGITESTENLYFQNLVSGPAESAHDTNFCLHSYVPTDPNQVPQQQCVPSVISSRRETTVCPGTPQGDPIRASKGLGKGDEHSLGLTAQETPSRKSFITVFLGDTGNHSPEMQNTFFQTFQSVPISMGQ